MRPIAAWARTSQSRLTDKSARVFAPDASQLWLVEIAVRGWLEQRKQINLLIGNRATPVRDHRCVRAGVDDQRYAVGL